MTIQEIEKKRWCIWMSHINGGNKEADEVYSQMGALLDAALEKQIPKKPTIQHFMGYCECGERVGTSYLYCKRCGQRLKWD